MVLGGTRMEAMAVKAYWTHSAARDCLVIPDTGWIFHLVKGDPRLRDFLGACGYFEEWTGDTKSDEHLTPEEFGKVIASRDDDDGQLSILDRKLFAKRKEYFQVR